MGKKGFQLFIYCLCIWVIARFCHHQTDGFRLEKLRDNTTRIQKQISEPLPIKEKEILNQKFHYLGRGLQSFSFLSDDGTTVLKIFNNRYQKRLKRLKWVPSIGPFKTWKDEKIAYNQRKLRLSFASYELASTLLKKETGLLYLHPEKTEGICPTVSIIDKLNIAHKIDLNRIGFALQKKATLPYLYLKACAEKQDWQRARNAIKDLVHLMKYKMELGIADRDPLIRANCGILEDRAIQIDIGPLSLDPSLKNAARQKKELKRMTLSLRHHLENHHPQMLPYFYEAIENN